MRRICVQIAVVLTSLVYLPLALAFGQTAQVEFPPIGGLVTLFAYDAELATLSFLDGKSGMVMKNHVIYNRDSHLAFDIYEKDSLRVGIQGRQRGSIIDLGTAEELEARYGYRDTVGRSQGFASIHRESDKLVILKDSETHSYQPLKEATLLLDKTASIASAPVRLGHIYLVRIVEGETEIVTVKLRLLAFTPGQSVTIRWERL